MKEITRIITAEITCIFEVDETKLEDVLAEKDAIAKAIKKCLPGEIGADDVTVIKMQDFVLDIEPKE